MIIVRSGTRKSEDRVELTMDGDHRDDKFWQLKKLLYLCSLK